MKKVLILLFMFCFSMPVMAMDAEYLSNGHIYKIGDMRVRYSNNRISEIGNMDVEYLSNGHIYKIGDMRVRYSNDRISEIGN